jgi:hypothetical protein
MPPHPAVSVPECSLLMLVSAERLELMTRMVFDHGESLNPKIRILNFEPYTLNPEP